ncbi:MAG: sodium/proton antiporter NhaB [Gammaproteobacteria bacterium]|nr:sodium/proton antiporter NhaB [Gammaproteobacteria bacterium]
MGLKTFTTNFLGAAPQWYKNTIVAFLVLNPILWWSASLAPFLEGSFLEVVFANMHTVAGWALVLQFIFTLAMALRCYPLQPGGLLAIEAIALGMTNTKHVYQEIVVGFPVILLLLFMVTAIFFMRELLLFIFTKLLVRVRSQILLAFLFSSVAAVLSAFLDALTVTAVVISVGLGFWHVYNEVAEADRSFEDDAAKLKHEQELEKYRAFLRGLLMHAAVGTAIGGVMTTVGEPQNLLISKVMGWDFIEFFLRMAIVTLPVMVVGFCTCVFLELTGWFHYGAKLPNSIREILQDYENQEDKKRTTAEKAQLVVQAIAAILLVFALAFHIAEVGIVGLMIIVIQTAFNGIVDEHRIADGFGEALPFISLLVVFFAIVAVIHDQHLFAPVVNWVLTLEPSQQPGMFYIANGLLSAISDNVFVATVYITEIETAFESGTIDRHLFDTLAIAVNTGTNIPSVLTPNGQAAFLFLLTTSLAPLIRLSYLRMVKMAFPYFVTMGLMGWIMVTFFLYSG